MIGMSACQANEFGGGSGKKQELEDSKKQDQLDANDQDSEKNNTSVEKSSAPPEADALATSDKPTKKKSDPDGEPLADADGVFEEDEELETDNAPKAPKGSEPQEESFKINRTFQSKKTDIVMAMDTSGSMSGEQDRLEKAMENFLSKLSEKNAKVDFKFTLIGSDFQLPAGVTNNKNFSLDNTEVDSHDALEVLTNFITDSKGTSLREDAILQLIVVSDDDARDPGAAVFSQFLAEQTFPEVHFNSIVGLKEGEQSDWCDINRVGNEYKTLSEDEKTKGVILDLCSDDWTKMLDVLADSIKATVGLEFELNNQVADDSKIEVSVDGQALDADQFSYDEATNTVSVEGMAIEETSDTVTISYGSK